MADIVVTFEGSAASVRSSMIALLGMLDQGLPTSKAHLNEEWTEAELRMLYKSLRTGARGIIAEVATKPRGYPMRLLQDKLNLSAVSIGAQSSSIGHNMKKFPGRPHPIHREAGEYRMDESVAAAILKIASEEG